MSREAADDFGLDIGDSVSASVLGRETATIANLREIDWQSFQINFVFVLTPGCLMLPHSWIATTRHSEAAADVERAVTVNFQMSAVSVKGSCHRTAGDQPAGGGSSTAPTLVAGLQYWLAQWPVVRHSGCRTRDPKGARQPVFD